MSLQPAFHSTHLGTVVRAGQLLSALAFALMVLAWLVDRPPLADRFAQGPEATWAACC